jgi:ATP-dependent DNA helicase PIF1
MAACNINGTTLHQFSGLGREDVSAADLAKAIDRKDAGQRWRAARTLIIDEISMVCAADFDRLCELGRILRADPRPFGGLQLIACGDFFQASTPPRCP